MRTARMKYDKETYEECMRGVSMERRKADTKKISPDGLSLPNQKTIIINIIWYYITWKNNYEIQLTKK